MSYLTLRFLGSILSLLPHPLIFSLGKIGGFALYYLHREFRKKAITNLYIAFGKKYAEKKLKQIARRSFQNLAITCLEFIALRRSKRHLAKLCHIEGGEEILALLGKKQGIVFLSAHQANWEIPFLAITSRFPGVAIGRPIKNKKLYQWILSVRESFGGKIVSPKQAVKEGIKALNAGTFVGIVGDQAFCEGSYTYPLFGTRAWTSTLPALLACRTNSPLVAAITRRQRSKYVISSSPPIWPDPSKPLKEEVPRLMNCAMEYLEKSIEQRPSEWLWQHDRWKQQKVDHVKRLYRFAFILITLPENPTPFLPLIPLFREIYPRGFLSFFLPKSSKDTLCPPDAELLYYENPKDLFVRNFSYQIVFDFIDLAPLRRHFRKLGAFQTLNLKALHTIAGKGENICETLLRAICKEDAPRSLFY